MRTVKASLYLLCLISLVSLSACKMTEEQIRSLPPGITSQQDLSVNLAETKSEPPQQKPMPMGVLFAGIALLAGTVIYLKSDSDRDSLLSRILSSGKRTKRQPKRSKRRKKS